MACTRLIYGFPARLYVPPMFPGTLQSFLYSFLFFVVFVSIFVPSGRLVCRRHDVFLWCCVCFVLLHFRLYAFVEAAPLRLIVIRYAGAPRQSHVFLFFFLQMSLFPSIFVAFPLSLCSMDYRVRRTFFPSE